MHKWRFEVRNTGSWLPAVLCLMDVGGCESIGDVVCGGGCTVGAGATNRRDLQEDMGGLREDVSVSHGFLPAPPLCRSALTDTPPVCGWAPLREKKHHPTPRASRACRCDVSRACPVLHREDEAIQGERSPEQLAKDWEELIVMGATVSKTYLVRFQ
jgi:hypothetical protein